MKSNKFKSLLAILILVLLFVCIWGVPLEGAEMSVKANGSDVRGTFTGTWSPVKGKEGTFTADEGWVFEGIINRDGGMWKGELTHFPIPLEWREESVHDLPEFYTGTVEENTFVIAISEPLYQVPDFIQTSSNFLKILCTDLPGGVDLSGHLIDVVADGRQLTSNLRHLACRPRLHGLSFNETPPHIFLR